MCQPGSRRVETHETRSVPQCPQQPVVAGNTALKLDGPGREFEGEVVDTSAVAAVGGKRKEIAEKAKNAVKGGQRRLRVEATVAVPKDTTIPASSNGTGLKLLPNQEVAPGTSDTATIEDPATAQKLEETRASNANRIKALETQLKEIKAILSSSEIARFERDLETAKEMNGGKVIDDVTGMITILEEEASALEQAKVQMLKEKERIRKANEEARKTEEARRAEEAKRVSENPVEARAARERARQAAQKEEEARGKREAAERRAALQAQQKKSSSPTTSKGSPSTSPVRPSESGRLQLAPWAAKMIDGVRTEVVRLLTNPDNASIRSEYIKGVVCSRIRHQLNQVLPGSAKLATERTDNLRNWSPSQIQDYVKATYTALLGVFGNTIENQMPGWMKTS